MPATVTLKQCKKQLSHLPKKQRTALAEDILQEDYERECLEKAEQCARDIKAGKETTIPLDEAMRNFRKSIKRTSAR